MKYPQLVSTRAVSAISDWLVTQLEQLGVDASSVYSRLLLSLLHTPLQINALDLAEISDNKVGNLARNKSFIAKSGNGTNYRRFSAADTEALKRLAAIDSLLEAVPSDQQLSKIESLVDELSLKLREIEEQNGLEDSVFEIGQSEDNALCNSKLDPTEKKSEAPEDPAKRYFNAFPALSDQSKNDYSHKTTSWPQVNTTKSTLDQQPDDPSSSTGSTAATKKKTKRRRVTNSTMTSTMPNPLDAKASNAPNPPSKIQSGAMTSVNKNGRAVNSKTNQKKKSNDMWDTDFDGAWEMGRDLIREFVLKQNNRNRSISECDSARCTAFETDKTDCGVGNDCVDLPATGKEFTEKRCNDLDNDEENLMRVAAAATSALFGKNFDMNMYALNTADSETVSSCSRVTDSSLLMSNNEKTVIRSEGYATPDTLASWNEIEATVPRRERDPETMNFTDIAKGCHIDTGSDCVDSGCDETNYLAAFEAKFDRNVEALWNNCKQDEPKNDTTQLNHSFWFDYDNNATDKQSARPAMALSDQFKGFFQSNQTTSNAMNATNGIDKNPFAAAQPNSLSSNASSAIGGMNLTSSIWTDNPNNNEDDVSFYANARLWEMNQSKSMGQKFNFYSIEPTANLHSTTTMIGATSSFDIGNYENSSFSKWSDTEKPLLPIQSDAGPSPQKTNEEKIRKNLFGNSYFYNYQSSQTMNNSNGQTMAPAENSIAEYSIGQAQNVTKRNVTLVNHSPSSCFKKVEPLSFEAKQVLYCMNNAKKYPTVDANDHEDLLTSERTRFRPIKQTYADGYTFDISNKLDEISYERSKSGMLYHNSEVYREYYVYDEEGNGGSRCEGESDEPVEFTLKYCIRQNDKSCQTDDSPPNHEILSPNLPLLLNADTNRMRSTSSLSSANSSSSRSHLLYYQSNDFNSPEYTTNKNTFDKLIDISQDGWCLDENRQCCNNNNNVNALWEHCATCSNDVISMPANRLLKDELSADGDEIMSDLKYLIQSISFQSDWEDRDSDSMADCDDDDDDEDDDDDDDDDDDEMVKPKVCGVSHNLLTDVNKLNEYDDNMSDGNGDDFTSNHIYSNVNKLISDLLQPEKAQTLVQAISEKCQGRLLTDEIGGSGLDSITKIIHDTKDVQATKNQDTCNSSPTTNANASANSNRHFGSLWAYNDNSIWRKELPAEIEVKHSGDASLKTAANRLCEQWEHANLEKIWKNIPATDDQCTQNYTSMTAKIEPKQSETEQTINSTSLNDDDGVSTKRTAFIEHTKPELNTLEKFMNLIKQANAQGQCPGASSHPHSHTHSHTQTHNDRFHKNATRYDRKRRHSATSQNYFDQMNCALNNCDTIENIKKLATKTVNDYDAANIFNCDATKKPTTTTIITCKYWTACDSFCLTSTLAFNNNNNIVGDTTENMFNCYHNQQPTKYQPDKIMDTLNGNDSIMMQPSTFLKQVAAMVSRPLTR